MVVFKSEIERMASDMQNVDVVYIKPTSLVDVDTQYLKYTTIIRPLGKEDTGFGLVYLEEQKTEPKVNTNKTISLDELNRIEDNIKEKLVLVVDNDHSNTKPETKEYVKKISFNLIDICFNEIRSRMRSEPR